MGTRGNHRGSRVGRLRIRTLLPSRKRPSRDPVWFRRVRIRLLGLRGQTSSPNPLADATYQRSVGDLLRIAFREEAVDGPRGNLAPLLVEMPRPVEE